MTAATVMPEAPKATDRLITVDEVATLVAMTPLTIKGLVKTGRFPAPLRTSHKSRLWRLSDVEKYIASPNEV